MYGGPKIGRMRRLSGPRLSASPLQGRLHLFCSRASTHHDCCSICPVVLVPSQFYIDTSGEAAGCCGASKPSARARDARARANRGLGTSGGKDVSQATGEVDPGRQVPGKLQARHACIIRSSRHGPVRVKQGTSPSNGRRGHTAASTHPTMPAQAPHVYTHAASAPFCLQAPTTQSGMLTRSNTPTGCGTTRQRLWPGTRPTTAPPPGSTPGIQVRASCAVPHVS